MYLNRSNHLAERALAGWATKEFAALTSDSEVVATVVTLHQYLRREDGTIQYLDRGEATKAACVIVRRLNQAIFGNTFRRRKKRLQILATVETGSSGKNLHLNFSIAVPLGRLVSEVRSAFEGSLKKLRWAENTRYSFVEAYDPEGWANYILKEDNSILLEASHFATSATPSH